MSLLTPAEAEALVLAAPPTLETESVALDDATGRVLAIDLLADRPLPPYDRVMMDGIAMCSANLGGATTLAVHGLHPAGAPAPAPLPAGHCWEIMTGACLPPDCDTIIPYEDTSRGAGDTIAFPAEAVQPGRYVHACGSDFQPGAVLAPRFSRLGAREVSVAATIGATTLTVLRRPRVALLTTGDELVPVDQQPAPHQVRRSNGPAVRAALHGLGAELARHDHVPDDEAATTKAVKAALDDTDLLLLCGGISKGKRDFVRPVIEGLLGPPAFHGIAQRPGKPLAFWQGPPPVAALPGNPMSVLVCFHRYVRPLLERMLRQPPRPQSVELASPFEFAPPLAHFLPVRLDTTTATLRAEPQPLANSGDFASSIGTDGFIELPAERSTFPAGFAAPFFPWL